MKHIRMSAAPQQPWLQKGQTMVFAMAFAISAGLIALLLFNSGMLANAKTRLQNTADAAAYSAGVLQARDHNFSAYINRAMVANQVAVVQIVSLKSYFEDAADTHERMSGPVLSFEAEMYPREKTIWDTAKRIPMGNINSAMQQLANQAVPIIDGLIKVFETAQQAHHTATGLDMALVANEVVKRNDPHARLTTGIFTTGRTMLQVTNWHDSTRQHRANDDSTAADRFADVTVSDQSTDAFTRSRTSMPLPAWLSTVKPCESMPYYAGSMTVFKFTHAGGSLLSADKKRWLALDASLGSGIATCLFLVPCGPFICPLNITIPLVDDNVVGGSGGGLAGADGGYDSRTGYKNNPRSSAQYGGALIHPETMIPAQLRYQDGPGTTLDSKGGLQDYYRDVAHPATPVPDQAPENNGGAYAVTFEIERPGETVRTSGKFLSGAQNIRLDDAMKSNTLKALSSAHAYFYRPNDEDPARFSRAEWRRADGKTETANLFSPYWQARLVDRSQADRAASWAAH